MSKLDLFWRHTSISGWDRYDVRTEKSWGYTLYQKLYWKLPCKYFLNFRPNENPWRKNPHFLFLGRYQFFKVTIRTNISHVTSSLLGLETWKPLISLYWQVKSKDLTFWKHHRILHEKICKSNFSYLSWYKMVGIKRSNKLDILKQGFSLFTSIWKHDIISQINF